MISIQEQAQGYKSDKDSQGRRRTAVEERIERLTEKLKQGHQDTRAVGGSSARDQQLADVEMVLNEDGRASAAGRAGERAHRTNPGGGFKRHAQGAFGNFR